MRTESEALEARVVLAQWYAQEVRAVAREALELERGQSVYPLAQASEWCTKPELQRMVLMCSPSVELRFTVGSEEYAQAAWCCDVNNAHIELEAERERLESEEASDGKS